MPVLFLIPGFSDFLIVLGTNIKTNLKIPASQNQQSFQDGKFNEVLADKAFVFSEIAMIFLSNEFVIWMYENSFYTGCFFIFDPYFFSGSYRHLAR